MDPQLESPRPPRGTVRRAPSSRAGAAVLALLALGASHAAQQPLFTFVQTSDSQAGSESEWQGFEDVLELIARAGTPGALLPRPVDLVLFAGDITLHNNSSEWVRCRSMFDTWLTSNNIPLLCIPGNHDQGDNPGTTQLYEQYIGSAAVWETGSASFTGQNGKSRNTGWSGLRIIGFNSSVGDYNVVTASDIALIQSRVSAAAAASENILLLTHHPHDGSGRMPLASVLTQPAIVGYVRGHSGNPRAQLGLSGVNNPNVWDLNTNAIVYDRDVIYYEVFQSQLKAYVIELNDNPSSLPTPKIIPLVYQLRSGLPQSIGFQGGSHNGARPWPSGFAPEKKLWFQGGNWFGVLWHESSLSWRIFRLDTFAQNWVDTGTVVSSSSTRSFDALTDGTKLYLASHVYSVPSAPGSGSGGQVLRYSYNATTRTYALDAGFPVTINDARTEALSLAKDTTGTLWATWTADGNVYENHSVGGDTTWSGPALLPFASSTGLDAEDVSALVAFDGKVALLWTDRNAGELACAVRPDSAGQTTWLLESALLAPGAVSDTLDVAASSAGRLYVATTTPAGAVRLVRRDVGLAGSGSWSLFSVADATGLGQPIVLLDETQQLARVFATGASSSGGSALGGGVIYEKSAPLGTLAFGPGKGTVVLQDGQNFAMGRASSTRQPLSASTALVVVASNELSQRSWHEFTSLGTPPPPPTADFSGSPRSGTAPLLVHFTDQSSGAPTDWLWTFGDGQTSTASSPDHVYSAAGAYSVSLRASNSAGSNTVTRSAYVNASAPPSPVVTLTAIADATANEAKKSRNFGTINTVRVKGQTGAAFRAFVKFDLAGVSGTVTSAKLRLFVTDSSSSGGSVYPVSSSWTETGLTWNNQPTLPASSIANLASVTSGAWKEVDVTSAVTGTGQVSFALSGGSSDVAIYTSREGTSANRPQLVLTLQTTPQGPVADFSGSPLSGTAPLLVQFTDASSGTPTSWQWTFGDGTSSTQQSPQHSYTAPGTYTVALTASNANGSNTRTRASYVTVLGQGGGGSQTFRPIADARVYEGSPGTNYGLDALLRMKTQAGSTYRSYLQFNLAGLSGTPISARLRIFVTDESNSGGSMYLAPNSWSETTINWTNKPELPATPIATAGAAPVGTWVEFDVSSAILGPGTVSFGHAGGTTNSIYYWSREGTNPPELVVQTNGS